MRVWLTMSSALPRRRMRGVTNMVPKRTKGVPRPKTIQAMREPHEGLMTGPCVL